MALNFIPLISLPLIFSGIFICKQHPKKGVKIYRAEKKKNFADATEHMPFIKLYLSKCHYILAKLPKWGT